MYDNGIRLSKPPKYFKIPLSPIGECLTEVSAQGLQKIHCLFLEHFSSPHNLRARFYYCTVARTLAVKIFPCMHTLCM